MKRYVFILALAVLVTISSACKKSDEVNPDSTREDLSITSTNVLGSKNKTNVDTTYVTIISNKELKPDHFVNRYWYIAGYVMDNYTYQLAKDGNKKRVDFKFTSSTWLTTTVTNPLTYEWVNYDGTIQTLKLGK
ncbi:hypothetical protein [Mucilaginibacter psychrotolerans]|uniref:Uncharacterized protein n=1 Tax=Mucilaginibacter psychrotolerans TaxID=1524096 RepID=A0A4Y8S6M6_9SPHI|nr:hypothetical protein [Mucilaginibacter psychrotolerans]TFF34406.1 hypothetical protein E2R66_22285 [Mucilaginibacter psychrotolerans]